VAPKAPDEGKELSSLRVGEAPGVAPPIRSLRDHLPPRGKDAPLPSAVVVFAPGYDCGALKTCFSTLNFSAQHHVEAKLMVFAMSQS